MKRAEVPDSIEPWRIVCAAQSEPDYSEERQILYYASECDDYHDGGPFVLLEGGHCSCYDWEDVDWYATEYTRDEREATLGRGTCRNVHEPPRDTTFWPAPHFKCSECGATHVSMNYVHFCPNCG